MNQVVLSGVEMAAGKYKEWLLNQKNKCPSFLWNLLIEMFQGCLKGNECLRTPTMSLFANLQWDFSGQSWELQNYCVRTRGSSSFNQQETVKYLCRWHLLPSGNGLNEYKFWFKLAFDQFRLILRCGILPARLTTCQLFLRMAKSAGDRILVTNMTLKKRQPKRFEINK